MTDSTSLAAQAWNAWRNSVSTVANDKHMETAFVSGFEAGAKAMQEAASDVARRTYPKDAFRFELGTDIAKAITALDPAQIAAIARAGE